MMLQMCIRDRAADDLAAIFEGLGVLDAQFEEHGGDGHGRDSSYRRGRCALRLMVKRSSMPERRRRMCGKFGLTSAIKAICGRHSRIPRDVEADRRTFAFGMNLKQESWDL